jgi:hypothetical protein
MAQWQRKIDLKDVWDSGDVHLIAKTLSESLRKLKPLSDEYLDYTRDELAEQFADIAADMSANTSDFDAVMTELYDWADTPLDSNWNGKKVCWVATF